MVAGKGDWAGLSRGHCTMSQSPSAGAAIHLPIELLPAGPVGPTREPLDPSWEVLAGWEDPLAIRGGYAWTSVKTRTEIGGRAVLEWRRGHAEPQMLVEGSPEWQDYTVRCEVLPTQVGVAVSNDDALSLAARAGLIFRMRTVRHHYLFCIEDCRRAVLYRRSDDDWRVLAEQPIALPDSGRPVVMEVRADGAEIHCRCEGLAVDLACRDTAFPAGRAGFWCVGGVPALRPGDRDVGRPGRRERLPASMR